jgi:endonuclease/exonuclease/phosphatase family metal-dependent hydrolase
MLTQGLVSQLQPQRQPTRRRWLAASLAALAAAVTFTGLAPIPVPAQAAPVAPTEASRVSSLVVVPGRDRVTATWTAVAGATSYRVSVSTSRSVVKTVTTTSSTAVVAGLKKSSTYYVQVAAVPGAAAAASTRVKTKTTSATTGRGQITSVAPDGVNTIKVTWKRFSKATSIDIRLSWDNKPLTKNQKGKYAQFTGYPATATSATLKIPSAYVSMIGSTSGNPAYVRLISHNGPKSRTSKVAFGWPTAYSASGTQLKVATYNVMSSTARPSTGSKSWSGKRGAVLNAVKLAAPDVLLTQEVIPNPAWPGTTYSQLEDFTKLASSVGLDIAYPVERVQSTRIGSRGNHIYVRTDKVAVIESGLVPSSELVSGYSSSLENRYYAWAKLQVRDTGEYFYAVSMHLLSQSAGKGIRLALTRAMLSYIDKLNPQGYPVVLGGDLNAGFLGRDNFEAPDAIRAAGYIDTASANRRSNVVHSTSNNGFPSRPKSYAYVGTRIDYLFVKNTNGAGPIVYANQGPLNSNGTFNQSYYGSDHNLQWAVISLGQSRT